MTSGLHVGIYSISLIKATIEHSLILFVYTYPCNKEETLYVLSKWLFDILVDSHSEIYGKCMFVDMTSLMMGNVPLAYREGGHSRLRNYFWVSNGRRIFLDNFTCLVCLDLYCKAYFGSYLHFILHIEYTYKVNLEGIGSSKLSFWFLKWHLGVLS